MDVAVGAEGGLAHQREGIQTEAVLAQAAGIHVGLALGVPDIVLGRVDRRVVGVFISSLPGLKERLPRTATV